MTTGAAARNAGNSPTVTAEDYARLFDAKCDRTWAAGDGAASRLAPSGARFWLFGDTIVGFPGEGSGFAEGRSMVSNSILVQRGMELGPATWSDGTAAVPDSGGHRYWTTDILFSETGGSALVLCQRVHDGPEGFVTDGAEIAEFHTDAGADRLTFVGMTPTPTTPGALEYDEIQWSLGWEKDGGYLYVYGYRQHREPGFATPHLTYVAKTQPGLHHLPARWRFWDGSTWSLDKRLAMPILDGQLTSVRRIGDRWLFAHKPWHGYGDAVHILTADRPEGPLTLARSFPSPGGTTTAGRGYVTYNPTLHPGALALGGTLLAVSRNGAFADIFAERTLYHPMFLGLTLP